ncbi:AsmA family protein [Profundibacter sp.]
MRLLLRFILVLFVLVVVAIGALLFMPGDKIARFAEEQFESATGRAITIGGDVRTSIYPLLGVRTGPISIANAKWSDAGPMLQAEGMSIGVDLVALFSGDVKIKKIEVIAPQILLEIAKDGRANWEMVAAGGTGAGAGDAGGIPAFSLGRGVIRDARLIFIDHASGEKTSLSDMDAELRLPRFTGRADVSLSARMNGQAISLTANVAAFDRFLSGAVGQLVTTMQIGASKIEFKGKAGIAPLSADGKINANLADMAALFGLIDMPAPDLPKGMGRNALVTGRVTYTAKGTAHLRNGLIKLDHNVFSGGVDMFFDGERARLKANISADALDFSVLAASVDDSGQRVEVSGGWPKDVIDVSGLGALDANVSLAANSINLGTVQLGLSSVNAKLDRSRVVFTLNEVQTYKGTIKGEFVVNGRGGLSVGGNLTAAGLAMTPLLRDLADYERLVGVGGMQLKFLGVGNTLDAIMHSLSGSGSFNLGQGEILGLDLGGMLRNLDASYRGEGQKTVFNSIGAKFTIKDGVLHNDDLSFIAPLAKALGAGDIGIGTQTLNYRVNPVAMVAEDGSGGISVPVLITGTWANPKFRPDLQALIDQNLAEEKAALEAKIAAEKAAAKARLAAKKAELEARLAAEKAEALQRAQEVLDVEIEEGETLEDAAKRKLDNEIKRGLLDLLEGD